ncbi:MAG: hypothetical protein LBD29_06110 [Treponema sp.]|jgi:hypothetical protein|nr:hypothetical protein [Treponema sp.]
MNHSLKTFLFRDLHTPLSTLAGAGLLIMASSRLAFGLVTGIALLWVYDITVTILFFTQPIYPNIGKKAILILLTSFLGSCYLLLLWFFSPLLAMETGYVILLVPCYCIGSSTFSRINLGQAKFEKLLFNTSLEAGSLGILIVAFALIREPIGFMSLSVPGGPLGIIEVFPVFEGNSFLPIRVIGSSAGAFLLLGYGAALFRNIKKSNS